MSNPLIESLKIKLNVSLRYFSQVVHIGIDSETFRIPLILCLSEHSVLFLDSNFSKLLGEVFYAHFTKVIEQEDKSTDVIRFEYSDLRPQGIPKKMTMITGEKKKIINYLRCCWETDYMWRMGKTEKLKIFKEKIDLRKYKGKVTEFIKKDLYLNPPSGYKKVEYRSYCYYIKEIFKATHISTEFSATKNDENYLMNVKIKEVRLIEQLNSDMRTVSETLAENLLEEETDFSYVKNCNYTKKFNLVMDIAKWEGWHVLLKTPNKNISVVLLRRKYIPPMMDSGQDIYVTCIGGNKCEKYSKFVADSLFTLGISSEVYSSVLTQRAEGLIMDEETCHYYQTKFKIKPSKVYYGYQLILSVLVIIDRQISDLLIKKIIEDVLKNPQAKDPEAISEKIEEPFKYIDNFCRSCFLEPGSKGFKIWCKKVYRYLAYCINGGLLQNRVNLDTIFAYLLKIKLDNKDTDKIQVFIARMLDIREFTNDNEEFDDLHSGVVKMLESSGFTLYNQKNEEISQKYTPFKQWRFNPKVMQSLIETGYVKKDLEMHNLGGLYPKLLVYLLQKRDLPLFLALSICRVTINMNETSDSLALKSILPHLIDTYRLGNYTLATQSAIALANLTYTNRENKQLLYASMEHIITRLHSKDSRLLTYSILLLINLSSDPSKRKAISKEAKNIIRKIIIGNGIIRQTTDVIGKAFQLFAIFSKDHNNADTFSNDVELISVSSSYIGLDDESDLKILTFFENICERNQNSRILVGRNCIEKFIEILKAQKSIETCRKVIDFFKKISGNREDENYYIFISNKITKVLDGLLQNPNLTIDESLVKAVKEFRLIFKS